MAKLSETEIDQIVRDQLPGYRVVSRSARPLRELDTKHRKAGSAEAASPSLADLKEKYLTGRRPLTPRDNSTTMVSHVLGTTEDPVDEIVVVEKEGLHDAMSRAGSRKRAVISTKDRRITGMQG